MDYREIAQTWMSAAGNNSDDFQRRDFAKHSLEFLADDCIKSWDDKELDRARLIEALADWRDWLEARKLAAEKAGNAAEGPQGIGSSLLERTLIAIQAQLATLNQRVGDVQDDQKAMREQVDVIVMTSLRLERVMTSLRQDVRTLRDRIDSLKTGPIILS